MRKLHSHHRFYRITGSFAVSLLTAICALAAARYAHDAQLGLFDKSGDVGEPAIKGAVEFAGGQYKVTGSGANIWGKRDQFHYVWREMTGNFTLAATVRFLGQGAEHRKTGLMVRQSLDEAANYGDVLIHGNGMPGLQWRSKPGDDTNTFDFPFDGPATYKIKLVRSGVRIFMYLGKEGATVKEMAHTEVSFHDPVLAGLVVCSHQPDASDTAVFSDVSVEAQQSATPAAP